ncbi:uncharacterized protein ACRADG_010252 [Cochliomyia hominivorax]
MEEEKIINTPSYPAHAINFPIPNERALKRTYQVYKPSPQTLQLLNEQNRSVYADAFIENRTLGPLTHLCVRILATSFGPDPLQIVANNPLLLQVHYDALDVDLPLKKCYRIIEERYWERVVLTKHKDKSLQIKKDIDWKELGLALKLVEMLEECPVEYWSEEEIKDLSLKIKDFIKEIHIKRLQSLREHSFEKYFLTETETSSSSSSEESVEDESSSLLSSKEEDLLPKEGETESQFEVRKTEIKQEQMKRKELKQKAKELKELKRKKREERRKAREEQQEEEKSVKKTKKKKKIVNFFDIEISESEDDGEDRIKDKRNKALYLSHLKKYNYPAKDCHHIDLSFIQYFTELKIFILEFWGPLQGRNYHEKHRNFSIQDIKNLAKGLKHLPLLHTFRLRNSRMDADKLLVLCQALSSLTTLEILDFANDQLPDDCGFAFHELFENTNSLKSLELETNCLNEEALLQLGKALKSYTTNRLNYLGLARNPITDQALHNFLELIIETEHIMELNIRGLKCLTEKALCCCVANKLLKFHKPLLRLDIAAVKISPLAANEIIIALEENKKLLKLYCVGCELDEEAEIDINILLQRNQYIAENYFVGDNSVTTEEVEKWLNRTRNPILLKVLAERKNQEKCLQHRSMEIIPSAHSDTIFPKTSDILTHLYDVESASSQSLSSSKEPQTQFIYPCNDFNQQEFLEHIYQPGPQNRYYYFKNYKEKFVVKENTKNISMI